MKGSKLRKKIESLKRQIVKHQEKIDMERQNSFPDEGCIAHWEKEISTFKKQIEKAMKKLGE
jgi:uncharacterized coiled-coil DUF342 family protein